MRIDIVIIGGSFAGHMAFRSLYKIAPYLDLHVTMVSMSSHAYFNVAAPRLLIEPEKFDDTIFPNEDFVKKYSRGKGTFIHGRAVGVDFHNRTVSVTLEDKEILLNYKYLVIATGTSSQFDGFKVNYSHLNAKKAIEETAQQIKTAKLIAVIGGGPTGVETAGELGESAKWAKVTLYTGCDGPLGDYPKLMPGASEKLEKLGVTIINSVRCKSVLYADNETRVYLENGDVETFDVVLRAMRLTAYSGFLPEEVKDPQGFVKTDRRLQVVGTSNVLAFGDIVSGSSRKYVEIKFRQQPVFEATMKVLLGQNLLTRKKYTPGAGVFMVPVSTSYGEGLLWGMALPNWMIRKTKSKSFFIERAGEELS